MRPNLTGRPEAQTLVYRLTPETGTYELTSAPLGFVKAWPRLRIEPTQRVDIKIKAKYLIKSIPEEGKKLFTGLSPVPTFPEEYYFGDHAERVKGQFRKSFILFQFTPDKITLRIFYFNNFYPRPDRGKFLDTLLG